MRYQRAADLVELTGILQTTATGLTIDEIAERFEVSRRTAERMLGALRDRFPDLRPDLRGGRKFWRLPASAAARTLQLPRTVDALSERISELESELAELRAIADGVLASAPIGLMILDGEQRVVRANDTFARMFGIPTHGVAGRTLTSVFTDHLRGALEDGSVAAERLLAGKREPQDDFECHVLPADGRPERWLRNWSRRIEDGPYAGGRIDRWVDITNRHAPAESAEVLPPLPETSARMLRAHLAQLEEATAELLDAGDLSEDVVARLQGLARSHRSTIEGAIEVMVSGSLKREHMVPREALDLARTLIQPHADDRGVELRVDVEPGTETMFGDRALSLSSLVLNAKITLEVLPKGSTLLLRVRRLEDPSRIRVSLIDDGPSLPPGFPALAGDFYPTREGGTGIGVAPVRDDDGGEPGGIEQYFELPVR